MHESSNKPERNSRWTRDPVNAGHRAAVVYPTDRDIEVFKLLTRYRYLPSDYIHAFVGGSLNALCRRLNFLCRRPNLYLARPQQQRDSANANHRRLIYELDERGYRVLRERGLSFPPKSFHRNFFHELMVAQIMASFELGTREMKHVRLIPWTEILASENTPKTTRESLTAASIRVSCSIRGERSTLTVTADGRPFGIERVLNGQRSYLFFPGVEADCATEPVDTSDLERSSILKKLIAYTAIAEQGIYRSHFGFPNFFVPFVVPTTTRAESISRLVEKLTEGRGSKMFLFKVFPGLRSPDTPLPAGGHMLSEPWRRVGYPPLSFVS